MTEERNNATDASSSAPEADSSIVAHGQSAATEDVQISTLVDAERGALPASSSLDVTLERLAESDTRRFGIQVILQMASAWSREMNRNFAILGNQNANLINDLAKAREENAAFKAKEMERAKHSPLVTSALLLGPIIFVFGLEQLLSDIWGTGLVAVIVGSIIIGGALYARVGDKS